MTDRQFVTAIAEGRAPEQWKNKLIGSCQNTAVDRDAGKKRMDCLRHRFDACGAFEPWTPEGLGIDGGATAIEHKRMELRELSGMVGDRIAWAWQRSRDRGRGGEHRRGGDDESTPRQGEGSVAR